MFRIALSALLAAAFCMTCSTAPTNSAAIHKARYFFANVVMFDNGVSVNTIMATVENWLRWFSRKYQRSSEFWKTAT